MNKKINDIDIAALDDLIKRVQEAKEHGLALSSDDCQLLLDALCTLSTMQENLASNDITIYKLKKLVGMVQSSESLSTSLATKRAKKLSARPKKTTVNKVKPVVKHHKLEGLAKGNNCPECETGKLYKYAPANLLRIVGQSPFTAEQHVMERLRCNTCGAYFTAEVSPEVKADGKAQQKYGYSARSIMGIAKYAMGSPFYRQGSLQDLLGVPITASTIFDQCEYLSNAIYPVFKALFRIAGRSKHFYLDDTTHRILNQKPILKKVRNSDQTRLRTGVYTSGVIATSQDNQRIVLFETNIGHAGEFIDRILASRPDVYSPPLLMSDALPSNRPSKVRVQQCFCNSHARRQFYDVLSHFPEEVNEVIECYSKIWIAEQEARAYQLNGRARLAYHKLNSLPVMEEILHWGQAHFTHKTVEENSSLGKAIRYFIKHYEGLTAFCRIENAQIDNNAMESQLKLVVRDRKNAMFKKSLTGASIGDVITSLIATAGQAGVNVFDYFNVLQREYEAVAATPEQYLPWVYQQNQEDKK